MPLLLMRSYPETLLDQTLPHGRAPAGRVRRRARRALGHLRVGLQPRRPPRHLPVQGVRRPRPRPEAGPRRRAGGGAVRDGAGGDGRSARWPRATCGAWRARGARAPTATTRRSTTRTGGRRAAADEGDAPGRARDVVVRAFMAHHQGMTLVALANVPCSATDGESASTPTRGSRPPSCCCRSGCRAHAPITQPRPVEETRAAGPAAAPGPAPLPLAAHAVAPRAVPVERQLHHGGHQRRRRRQLLPGPGRHAPPRGRHPRPGQPVHLPARRAQRGRMVRRPTTPWARAGGLPRDLPRREGDVPPPRRRHRARCSTSRSRPRTTSRCAGWR